MSKIIPFIARLQKLLRYYVFEIFIHVLDFVPWRRNTWACFVVADCWFLSCEIPDLRWSGQGAHERKLGCGSMILDMVLPRDGARMAGCRWGNDGWLEMDLGLGGLREAADDDPHRYHAVHQCTFLVSERSAPAVRVTRQPELVTVHIASCPNPGPVRDLPFSFRIRQSETSVLYASTGMHSSGFMSRSNIRYYTANASQKILQNEKVA